MYGVVKAELINGSARWPSRPRPWVAQITGLSDRWGFERQFIKGVYDYTVARRSGSRGIYLYWFLPPNLYEIYRPVSWRHDERFYFVVAADGTINKISKAEVRECLKNAT